MKSTYKSYRCRAIEFPRLTLGLSQQQLADALGVSRSLIAMMETGKRELPEAVHHVYLDLCKRANVMNPNMVIRVKRGRKSAGIAEDRVVRAVTNYLVTNFKTQQPGSSLAGDDQLVTTHTMVPKTYEEEQREQAIEQLKIKKDLLTYQYTGLEFKKRALEKRQQQLSIELMVATSRRNTYEKLLAMLPNFRLCKKFKALAKIYDCKAYKLERQLEKYGPIAMQETEKEMDLLKGGVDVLEQSIIKLEIEARKKVEVTSIRLLPAFPAMEQKACA